MDKSEVMQLVKNNLAEILEIEADQIDGSASMTDAGANSLDIVEVVSLTMRQLKIKIPRSDLNKIDNMAALVDLFHEALVAQTESG